MSADPAPPVDDSLDRIRVALEQIAEEQRIANVIAYVDLPTTGKSERFRATKAIRQHLNLGGNPDE